MPSPGESLVTTAGVDETVVGVLVTGVVSSLAELVVVDLGRRAGALTLAVGNVIGGNTFDALLVVAADLADRPGSVYAAVGAEQAFVTSISVVATAVIVLGLLRRERHGMSNIGFESVLVLVLYAAVVTVLT